MNLPASFAEVSGPIATAAASLASEGVERLRAALAIGQHTRLLQIDTPFSAGTLVVERVSLREAVHSAEPLWGEVDCLSTSAFLDTEALLGEPVVLHLKCADGRTRAWHAYAAEAAQLGADGGLARYRIKLAAWTHWLTLRTDTRIFQDKTAQDVVAEVCAAYPQARLRFDVQSPGALRPITTQYREDDWAFVRRLMAQEGWSWRLEHDQQAEGSGPQDRPAASAGDALPSPSGHCLVVFDAQASRPSLGTLRFSRPDLRGEGLFGLLADAADTITAWRAGERVGSNAVTLAAWDERQLAGVAAQDDWLARPGTVPPLEVYEGHGERRHADGRVETAQPASLAVAQQRAQSLLAAHRLAAQGIEGLSAVRLMREGASFSLSGHSLYDSLSPGTGAAALTALAVHHLAANNLGAEAARLLSVPELEQGTYRNRFDAAPAELTIAPLPLAKPLAPGPQTAVVVAAQDQPLTTDRDTRIRVQFGWQRGLRPLPGALAAPATPGMAETGHAPGDERSGTWLRVAQAMAGANWGAVFVPRAGTEVLVDFIDGDIDRPLVIGQLHNGQHDLPWPAGIDAAANHPGTVSGWHHQHLDGQGSNQWLIDDATGQLRMRLATQGACNPWSELSLGHLVQQSGDGGEGHAQRGTWLGEGFYAHTEGWAVVRAAQGLLLTSTARPARGASVHSTQMDAAEGVSRLRAARQLGQTLSQSAHQQGAHALHSHDDGQALQQHADDLDPGRQGRYDAAVAGQDHRKAEGRTLTAQPVERFAQPLLHLDTPTSASLVSNAALSLFSGQDTSFSVHGDMHITAAHSVGSVSGQTASLYTHAGGLKAITASGPLSLRAHTDAQQLWADQDITVQSTTDEIRVQAKDRIVMTAGQSQVELKGGDVTFTCPGQWVVKGGAHDWLGGGSRAARLVALPDCQLGEPLNWIDIRRTDSEGLPMTGQKYNIHFAGGTVLSGALDAQGKARHESVPKEAIRVEYLPRDPLPDRPWTSLSTLIESAEQSLG